MTPEDVRKIANTPSTPAFLFGSQELFDWTNQHRDRYTFECVTESPWYIVKHRDITGRGRDFRVLSQWRVGFRVPHSFDIEE